MQVVPRPAVKLRHARSRASLLGTVALTAATLATSCAIVDSVKSGLIHVGKYAGGIVRGEGAVEDGKQQGEWRYLNEDGRLRAEGRYENDIQVGLWTYYYDNGQKEYEGRLEGSRRVGRYQYWHINGLPRASGEFAGGREFGPWTFWNERGAITQRGTFANGLRHGKWTAYHADGTLASEGLYADGAQVGNWQLVDATGNERMAWSDMPAGWEWAVDQWDDGTRRREGFLASGRQQGLWSLFNRGGDLRLIGAFDGGTPSGHWAMFGAQGQRIAAGDVEFGRPVGRWMMMSGGRESDVDATAFPPAMPFMDTWSADEVVSERGVDGALSVRLSEVRSPVASSAVVAQTRPANAAPAAALAAQTESPDVPVVAQPFTVFEQSNFDALVLAYRKGGDAIKKLRSRYARVKSGAGGAALIPEPGGDKDTAARYIGKPLPLEVYKDQSGGAFDLESLRGQKVVLVVLRGYPGAVCVYCTAQTAALCEEGAFEKFEALGAKLQIVFPGEKNGLNAFKQAVGSLSMEEIPPYGMLYENDYIVGPMLDIEGSKVIPSTFILDENGIVQFAYVAKSDADRPSCALIVEELNKLRDKE